MHNFQVATHSTLASFNDASLMNLAHHEILCVYESECLVVPPHHLVSIKVESINEQIKLYYSG